MSDAIFTIFRLWRRSARDTCRLQLAMLPALGCTAFRSTFAAGDDSPPLVVVQAIKPSSSYTVLISAAQSPPVDWRTCAFSDMLWSLFLVSLTAEADDNGPLCLARCLAIGTFLFCPRRFPAAYGRTHASSRPKLSTLSEYLPKISCICLDM